MAKRFEQFINENQEDDTPFMRYLEIKEFITEYLTKELKKLEVGNESTTVITPGRKENIKNIGTIEDYVDDNGEYTHMLLAVRLFIGNSGFFKEFDSMADLAKHLIKVEDKIRSIVDVKKISTHSDYFIYLVPINDKLKNLMVSGKGIDKYKL